MDGVQSPTDKQNMIATFLEIAAGQTAETAAQFLQATSWKLEDALQLYYVGNEGGAVASYAASSPVLENNSSLGDQTASGPQEQTGDENARENDVNEVRAPIPVRRDVLYDNAVLFGPRMGHASHEAHSVVPFRNFSEEANLWAPDQGAASTADNSQDNLASLYRPPFALMFHGPFELAKNAAMLQNKWFIVNVQSTKEFSSHMLNRDTWANETVALTISTNFIFWQAYDDTEEGRKVCTYYKLNSPPEILVIDPVTGQKIRSWRGMVQPESLLEDLLPFMDGSPKDHHASLSHKRPRESAQTPPHKIQAAADATTEDEELLRALAASMENVKDSRVSSMDKDVNNVEKEEQTSAAKEKPTYPPLPEEPTGDKNLLCRVGVRLPDGRRLQRNFLRTDPIQLLWSFCYSQLKEDEFQPFRLTHAIPGASKALDYESDLTFADSGLANSMISATWE